MKIKPYIRALANKRKRDSLETALAMGVTLRVISKEFRLLEWFYKDRRRITYREELSLNQKPGTLLTRNKEITKILLQRAKVSVPPGIIAATPPEAITKMRERNILFPVAVKPIDGSKGMGYR